jgi:hypothetical protein
MEKPDNIVNSLMGYLYMTLTDGKKDFASGLTDDRFITWCLPGIPIDPEDLRFAREGVIGKGADETARARDTALLSLQAANFAKLMDFIPDVRGQQIVSFQPGIKSLSGTYEAVLRDSKIADVPLTQKEQAQLTKARNLLFVEQEVTDPDTGEKQMTTVDTPKMKAYRKQQAIFEKEFIEYNSRRIKADLAVSAMDVMEFERNGPAFEKRAIMALRDWEGAGNKTEIENAQAIISQITDKSLLQWKQRLKDRLVFDKKKHPTLGDYYPTSLVPASFLLPSAGWPSFTFKESSVKKFSDTKSTQYGGKAGFLGAFKIGASGAKSTETKSVTEDTTNFEISFEVAQIPLSMPYFDIAFLQSRAWKFPEDAMLLSDGAQPPKGMLVGYPTMVIFVRNVVINFKELHDTKSEVSKALKGKAGLSIGPFGASGKYTNSNGQTKSISTMTEQGLKVNGMQIIGIRCRLWDGKKPDPDPKFKNFI